MTDQDVLAGEPFSFCMTKNGQVRISHRGRLVTTLAGNAADKISKRLKSASPSEIQLILAKVTGNFKRGNEPARR